MNVSPREGDVGGLQDTQLGGGGDVWSRAGFSCFRIVPRAGQEVGTPLPKFCLVMQNSDDPGGVATSSRAAESRLASPSIGTSVYAGRLAGGGQTAPHRAQGRCCALFPNATAGFPGGGSEMSPQCCLLRKAALVPRIDLENLLLGSF